MSDVDPSRCAICGQPNDCAIVAANGDFEAAGSCWCAHTDIDPGTLASVPAHLQNKVCICRSCAKAGASAQPAGVTMTTDPGGRPAVRLDRGDDRVLIATTGAQVLSWHRGGHDVLWTASAPSFEPGKPVRGGIPVVFPWFGDHRDERLPAHGFGRSLAWQVETLRDGPEVTFALTDDDRTHALWPHRFRLELTVALRDGLHVAMTVSNTGDSAFAFEQALHTYFAVGDVTTASVHGLENVPFTETASEPEGDWDVDAPLRFRAETDRVFRQVPDELTLQAPALDRVVTLRTENAGSAVVWNPWPRKTARLSQMHADDWRAFCCVENANVGEHAVQLEPGASHRLTMQLRVSER